MLGVQASLLSVFAVSRTLRSLIVRPSHAFLMRIYVSFLMLILMQLTEEVLLQHRIKSPYSMWKKMEKKQVNQHRCCIQ